MTTLSTLTSRAVQKGERLARKSMLESASRPLRAGYVLTWGFGDGPSPADGPKFKIAAQLRRWRSLGVETGLFLCAREDCSTSWRSLAQPNLLEHRIARSHLASLVATRDLGASLRAFGPDFVYLRQEPYLPALANMMAEFPAIVELNGDEVREAATGSIHYRLYRFLGRRPMLGKAAAFVAVSNELAAKPIFTGYKRPIAVVPNGIDLDAIRPLAAPKNDRPTFVFIGARFGAPWHGAAEIIQLASRKPEWKFHIIGLTANEFPDGLADNVEAHGVLSRAEYERLMAQADVGIGTLGAYKIGVNEVSALKVREYLAYGLPVVAGARDSDFMTGAPFLLELENRQGNLVRGVERLEKFVIEWRGKRVDRNSVRHLDTTFKEKQRLDFILEVLGRPRRFAET